MSLHFNHSSQSVAADIRKLVIKYIAHRTGKVFEFKVGAATQAA
jgi:hypothetical protein